LSSFLQDGVPIDSLILKSVHPQLDLLPAGKPIKNPGDLITRGGIAQAVSQLAEQYDLVIIDSPPVLPVNDAAGLIGCVDITLFIARQGRVTQSEVDEALILLQRAGKQVTGTVFNGFVASRLRYGYGYKYGYYRYGYGNGYKNKGYNSDAAY
jgi:tyrosine-protein kinase Etk/Wzc